MLEYSDFSIAICTYNPNPRLLERVLLSIGNIYHIEQIDSILIVDNNSSLPVSQLSSVQDFLRKNCNSRCIIEPSQGLSFARRKAIIETSSCYLLFFDDDNQPSPDYLCVLLEYCNRFPCVAAWGPGRVEVEYVDQVSSEVYSNNAMFGERNLPFCYSCIPGSWSQCHPNGTGLALARPVLSQYLKLLSNGTLTQLDRCGTTMQSAGDVQIIWVAQEMGLAAGLIPGLHCVHLIDAEKASVRYLLRLAFGTAYSYPLALVNSYPQQSSAFMARSGIYAWCIRILFLFFMTVFGSSFPLKLRLKISSYFGNVYGHALVTSSAMAPLIKFMASLNRFL